LPGGDEKPADHGNGGCDDDKSDSLAPILIFLVLPTGGEILTGEDLIAISEDFVDGGTGDDDGDDNDENVGNDDDG